MATGCKQGGIFGSSLLYTVGFQSTLLAAQSALANQTQDHHNTSGCSTTEGISAFIDNTGLFVDARIADLVPMTF